MVSSVLVLVWRTGRLGTRGIDRIDVSPNRTRCAVVRAQFGRVPQFRFPGRLITDVRASLTRRPSRSPMSFMEGNRTLPETIRPLWAPQCSSPPARGRRSGALTRDARLPREWSGTRLPRAASSPAFSEMPFTFGRLLGQPLQIPSCRRS